MRRMMICLVVHRGYSAPSSDDLCGRNVESELYKMNDDDDTVDDP